MAEKARPKLKPRQLRKLFAMGLLSVKGSGKDRKVAYDKAKAASMKKGSGGGSSSQPRRDFSATREQRIAAGLAKPVPGSKRTAGELRSRIRELSQGNQSYGQRIQRIGRIASLLNEEVQLTGQFGSLAGREKQRQLDVKKGMAKAVAKTLPARSGSFDYRIDRLLARNRSKLSEVYKTDRSEESKRARYAQLKRREKTLEQFRQRANKILTTVGMGTKFSRNAVLKAGGIVGSKGVGWQQIAAKSERAYIEGMKKRRMPLPGSGGR